MRNLLAPNILEYIENFEKNLNLKLIQKLKIIFLIKYLNLKIDLIFYLIYMEIQEKMLKEINI